MSDRDYQPTQATDENGEFVGTYPSPFLAKAAAREGRVDGPEERRERYDARSELTSALDTIHLATDNPQLLAAAQDVFDTAVALGDAADDDQVETTGLHARKAHTVLRLAGARALYG
ncbi:hypothetical protein ABZ953_06775 [Streptomyces sp. NPDC046465]|uniref:hypothetical protein n=1 Tax=Streptomyces sp. NPDC046465 TaxID=3155810 RepID=UPI0033DB4468